MEVVVEKQIVEKTVKSSDSIDRVNFTNAGSPVMSELKKRTKAYFIKEGIESTGNSSLFIKAIFFISTFIAGYVAVVFMALPGWAALLICAYLGFAAAAIGFNIMHDGSHGSFSDSKFVNTAAAYCINILGGDALLWKNKHNIIHHTYTNIEGHDQDIAQLPVLRLNHLQPRYAFHKFQHIYCFLVYGLSSMLWVFLLDYMKYFPGKVGNFKIANITVTDHVIFWVTKVAYLGLYLALPAYFWGWGATWLGFFVFHFVLGLTLSVVFQLAHVVEETEFTDSHLQGEKIADEWAVHQLKTTANFATNNAFITWYVGGLNFQVEHHLFPKISHVHYPAINKIVKEVCFDMNVEYHEFPTFMSAVKSHVNHLKETASA